MVYCHIFHERYMERGSKVRYSTCVVLIVVSTVEVVFIRAVRGTFCNDSQLGGPTPIKNRIFQHDGWP